MANQISINNYDTHLAISPTDNSNRIDHIPAMVYVPTMTPEGQLILIKDRPHFNTPTVKYGDHCKRLQVLCDGYDVNSKSHGAILVGASGGGKSLLAEDLGNWFIKQDIPVLMITNPIPHQLIALAINAMGPCMVYIDEIGKLYDVEEEQGKMLSMFSSSEFTGVSFVITGNRDSEFHPYFTNRPQRFRYCIKYTPHIPIATVNDVLVRHKVNPDLHEAFRYYAEVNHLSLDSFLTAVNLSAGIADVNEMHDKLELINVPTFPYIGWNQVGSKQTFMGEATESSHVVFTVDGIPEDVRDYLITVTVNHTNIHYTPENTTLQYIPAHNAVLIKGGEMGHCFELYLSYGLTDNRSGSRSEPVSNTFPVSRSIHKQKETMEELFDVDKPTAPLRPAYRQNTGVQWGPPETQPQEIKTRKGYQR